MTAIDRTYRLSTDAFGVCNPDRIHVVRGVTIGSWVDTRRRPWQVWRGVEPLDSFATHTEAIRWAQWRAALDRYPLLEPMEAP